MGHKSEGDDVQYITHSTFNAFLGIWCNSTSDGVVDSIAVRFDTIAGNARYQCALYNYVDYSTSYIGTIVSSSPQSTTQLKWINTTDSSKWMTFLFNSSQKPSITSGTKYYLCIKPFGDPGTNNKVKVTQYTNPYAVTKNQAGAYFWDSPVTGEGATVGYYCMYANYTIVNSPPTITSYAPVNASTGIDFVPSCNINVSDPTGETMTIDFYENSTGSWVQRQKNSTCSNGTYRWKNNQATGYNTKYWWKATVNDGTNNVTKIYYFTTKTNPAPTVTSYAPLNSSTGISLTPRCNVTVSDSNGDTMTIDFYENSTGSWVHRQKNSTCSNGTYRYKYLNATSNSHRYFWKVCINDGTTNVTKIYHFITVVYTITTYYTLPFGYIANIAGVSYHTVTFGYTVNIGRWTNWSTMWSFNYSVNFSSPSNVKATRTTDTSIHLTWNNAPLVQKTIIRRSKTNYPNIHQGIEIYNNTGNNFNNTGLSFGTRYYYTLWGYSTTLGLTTNTTVTNATLPGPPSNTIQLSNTSTKITMHWTKGTNASHTIIYIHNMTGNYLKYNGTNTTQQITGLTPSTSYTFRLYSYNNTYQVTSSIYDTLTAITVFIPSPPSNLKATSYNDTRILLTWTKGTGTHTVINRRNTGYPGNYTDGTTIYNGTGVSYYDTGLNASKKYYYSAWSRTGNTYSINNVSSSNYTRPQTPKNYISKYNTTLLAVNFTWDRGNGNTHNLVLRKTTGYPSSQTDGTNVSWIPTTTTKNYYNESPVITTRYYTVYSYNSTTKFYSRTGLNIPWGAIGVSVYNESKPSQALPFNLEVKNQVGNIVYKLTGLTNTHYIDVNDIPYGTNTIFIVESNGYKQRIYYKDISLNTFYNYSFYLPPILATTNGTTGGDTSNCVTRSFTNSINISNPAIDATIAFSHNLYEMISVEIYNKTLYNSYGGWLFVPDTKYTYTTSHVIINASYLDSNTTMARCSYYWQDCPGETTKTPLYYCRVVETIRTEFSEFDRPVENAEVWFQTYINTTGKYVNVSILQTDGNGYVSVYLLPSSLYQIIIRKTGYDNYRSDYTPAPANQYGQTTEKLFRIVRSGSTLPAINYTYLMQNITWSLEPLTLKRQGAITFIFTITSTDNKLQWYNMTITFYNKTQRQWITLNTQNASNPGGGSLTYTTPNVTGDYEVEIWFKKTGYPAYQLFQTGSLRYTILYIQAWIRAIPEFVWFLVIIVISIIIMGFCFTVLGTGLITGYIGLGVQAFGYLMKPDLMVNGFSCWVIWTIGFLMYTMGIFIWSRI